MTRGLTLELKGETEPHEPVAAIPEQAPRPLDEGPQPPPVPALPGDAEPLMTAAEVADLFRVHRMTVARWAKAG